MVSINVVFNRDDFIIVLVVVGHVFSGFDGNFFTIPSEDTHIESPFEWTITIKKWHVWAVFLSPFVFRSDDTLVGFTFINGPIVIEVTHGVEGFPMRIG